MTEAFAHENTPYGAYGEFGETPADHDWDAHNAEAEAYFAELDAIRAEDAALADQAWCEADPEYRALYSPVEQGYYDDDPSPYNGDYSEW